MADFEAYSRIDMFASVTPTETGQELTCSSTNSCRVRYDWNFTPEIEYPVPAIVYPGMIASVGVRGKNARWYKKED